MSNLHDQQYARGGKVTLGASSQSKILVFPVFSHCQAPGVLSPDDNLYLGYHSYSAHVCLTAYSIITSVKSYCKQVNVN